jgi:hypothetical protein
MTTVDLYVDAEDGHQAFALHGVWGPATSLGHAIWHKLLAGEFEAIGPINCAAYKARITGQQLLEMVSEVDHSMRRYAYGTQPAELAAALEPHTHYLVQFIEF